MPSNRKAKTNSLQPEYTVVTYFSKETLRDEVNIDERLDQLPEKKRRNETIQNIEQRNIAVTVCESGAEAREYLANCITAGDAVMNGRSTTLHEIGFTEYLDQETEFTYLKNRIRECDDEAKRNQARREAVTADVFFDSPNAIAATGEIVGVNGKGTSLGAWPYPAKRLVLVSGMNKIVPTVAAALDRSGMLPTHWRMHEFKQPRTIEALSERH